MGTKADWQAYLVAGMFFAGLMYFAYWVAGQRVYYAPIDRVVENTFTMDGLLCVITTHTLDPEHGVTKCQPSDEVIVPSEGYTTITPAPDMR